MKTIVCYGDSNTWGYMPKELHPQVTANNRFPWGVRWTSLLQLRLGEDVRVAEAGLNGRTTMFDCIMDEHRNGLADIDLCMLQQTPVDLVTLMLGTNDVKDYFGVSAYVISCGARRVIERIQAGGYGPNGDAPQVLLIAPARLNPRVSSGWLGEEFGAGALEKDAQLAAHLERVAQECGVHFLNAGARIVADAADGVHMNEQGHALMAEMVAEKVREILK